MSRYLKKWTPIGVNCGGTSVQVLAANPIRKFATFANASDVVIWLAFGVDAVVGSGVPVPVGGAYTMDADNLTDKAVNAIAASGSNKVLAGEEFS